MTRALIKAAYLQGIVLFFFSSCNGGDSGAPSSPPSQETQTQSLPTTSGKKGTGEKGTILGGGNPTGDTGTVDLRTPAHLEASLSTLDFGIQSIDSFTYKSVILTNTGQKSATGLRSLGLSAPYEFRQGAYPGFRGTCGTSLAAGASCTIQLAFHPTSSGRFTQTTFNIVYDGDTAGIQLPFLLDGTSNNIATLRFSNLVDDNTYTDYGTLAFGQTLTKTIHVYYFGNRPATGVTFSGISSPLSIITNTCGTTVTADCDVTVRFTSSSSSLISQDLKVTYHNSSYTAQDIHTLTATGSNQTFPATLSIGTVSFGRILNGSSSSLTVSVSKGGTLPATSVSASSFSQSVFRFLGGSYPGTGGTCTSTISANCTIVLQFSPLSAVNYSDTLQLNFHNGSSNTSTTRAVSGQGGNPAVLTLSPTIHVDFGTAPLNYAIYSVWTLTNAASSVSASNIVVSGLSAPFSYVSGCAGALSPGSSCTFTLRFLPTSVGSFSSAFNVSYHDGQVTQNHLSGTVSGVGTDVAYLRMSVSSYDFGTRAVGSTTMATLTIQYYGGRTASIQNISGVASPFSFPGDVFPGGGTCGTNITANCTLRISFTPSLAQLYTSTLSIDYDNGYGDTLNTSSSLQGRGSNTTAILAFSGLGSFGSLPISQTATRTLTLTNNGSAAASSIVLSTTVPYTVDSTTCTSSLAVGANCSVVARFSPVTPGVYNYNLTAQYHNGLSNTSASSGLTGRGTVAVMVSANGNHSCARNDIGQLKCWGQNNYGQLGLGDTTNRGTSAGSMGSNLPAVNLGTGRYPKSISLGYWHTCVILDNDALKCFGNNLYGQLGIGSSASQVGSSAGEMGDSLPSLNLGSGVYAVSVAAGYTHTCALLNDQTVKCWGQNAEGQLGLGDTVDRGSVSGDMGNNLSTVNLNGDLISQISVNTSHSCALTTGGRVKCWGNNFYGQLGQEDFANRGDGSLEMGSFLSPVDLGTGLVASEVVAGGAFTCVRLTNGNVKCWGRNEHGILGQKFCQDLDGNIGLCSNGDYPLALRGWGIGEGQMGDALGLISLGTGRTAVKLSAGNSHTCATLDNGTLKCWGQNDYGQLGLSDSVDRGITDGDMGDNLPAVSLGSGLSLSSVIAGGSHNCALFTNSSVKCWGDNRYGGLGLGDTNSRGDNTGEMGSSLPAVGF